ncbi:hypothetical protein [Promicromonospora panici]|uniref:hypothetical protein n=1 Tax=Promicromonospora panici TaxID=2219658 RepID=UPI00101D86DF|nr:hypothetical protein [Promicromonospora panici]
MNLTYQQILDEVEASNKALIELERARGADTDSGLPIVYSQGDVELGRAIVRHQEALNASWRALGLPEQRLLDPETLLPIPEADR